MSAIEEILGQVAERQSEKPRNKREQNRQEARQRLVDAWRELYVTRGGAQTPIGELAKKADVSVGTFYALFSGRDELTKETGIDCVRQMIDGIQERMGFKFSENAEVRVRAAMALVVDLSERYPREMLFLHRLLGDNTPEGKALENIWYEFWDTYTQDRLGAEYERAGTEIPFDPRVASWASRGMVANVIQRWLTDPDPIPRDVLVDSLTHLLASGMSPG